MVEPERFVPRRIGDLTDDLCAIPWSGIDLSEDFAELAHLTSALIHHRSHRRERVVVDAWEAAKDDPEATATVTSEILELLDRANYTPLTTAELEDALAQESLIPLRLEVDLDDYATLVIQRRGSHRETVRVPTWAGLRSEERSITVEDRIVVHTRVHSAEWFRRRDIDPTSRNLVPDHVSLQQFENVPRADVEMLLPSTRVRFRPIDSLMVGVPALASGAAVLVTKLLPTLGLMFLLVAAWLGLRDESPELDQTSLVILFGGAVTLGGFFFRQWAKLKNRRVEYLKTLTENLYFRTLGAGAGVLHALLAAAEQQDTAEILLAYRFLLEAPQGATPSELDHVVESWLRESCRREVDFEVDDALEKLRELDLVHGDDRLVARPVGESLVVLDRRWDDLFRHRSD